MSIIRRMIVEACKLHKDGNQKLALKLVHAAMESDGIDDFIKDEEDLVELESELEEMDETEDEDMEVEDSEEDDEDLEAEYDEEEDSEEDLEDEDLDEEDIEEDIEEDTEEDTEDEESELTPTIEARIIATINKLASSGKKKDMKLAKKLLAYIK